MNVFTVIGVVCTILVAVGYLIMGILVIISSIEDGCPVYKAIPAGIVWPIVMLGLWLGNVPL